MKQWEYSAISNPTPLGEKILNNLGVDGWELVSVIYTSEYLYHFKRQLQ